MVLMPGVREEQGETTFDVLAEMDAWRFAVEIFETCLQSFWICSRRRLTTSRQGCLWGMVFPRFCAMDWNDKGPRYIWEATQSTCNSSTEAMSFVWWGCGGASFNTFPSFWDFHVCLRHVLQDIICSNLSAAEAFSKIAHRKIAVLWVCNHGHVDEAIMVHGRHW